MGPWTVTAGQTLASATTDQTISTVAIGLFTLVATLLTMYLIARGWRRRD